MFWVYALYNARSAKIYIGQTNDVKRRLAEHNSHAGDHFTTQVQGEWVLIYSESVATRPEALKREQQLKSFKGREFVKQFIPG